MGINGADVHPTCDKTMETEKGPHHSARVLLVRSYQVKTPDPLPLCFKKTLSSTDLEYTQLSLDLPLSISFKINSINYFMNLHPLSSESMD